MSKQLIALALIIVVALPWALATETEYRTADGSGNNKKNPTWGSTGTYQWRSTKSNFPADAMTPNPRGISNLFANEPAATVNENSINMFESFFGQFINHDKEFTKNLNVSEFNVKILLEPSDPLYSPTAQNNFIIIALSPNTSARLTRRGPYEIQSVNHASSWLDLSGLYGNTAADMAAMRASTGGRLKSNDYTVTTGPFSTVVANQLPSQASTGLPIDGFILQPPSAIVTAGDERVNENIGLAIITTIFMREHNRLADQLKAANPSWTDEKLFQEARKINIAQYQHIIFDEYLPAILSPDLVNRGRYRGYKKNVDGSTTLEFALGAFRYGHSTTAPWTLLNATNCPYNLFIPAGPITIVTPQLPSAGQLGGPFGVPQILALAGQENVMRGLLRSKANKVDIKIADVIRNVIFAGSTGRGVDIFVADILRGRFLGLGSYHTLRKKFFNGPGVPDGFENVYDAPGCTTDDDDCDDDDDDEDRRRSTDISDPLECFLQVTSDVTVAQNLRSVYGKVSHIDGIVGLLAEDHVGNAFLPRTMANIIFDEYKRSRDGDRFWFENDGVLTRTQLNAVRARSFADIIRSAFPAITIDNDVFRVPATVQCGQA